MKVKLTIGLVTTGGMQKSPGFLGSGMVSVKNNIFQCAQIQILVQYSNWGIFWEIPFFSSSIIPYRGRLHSG